MQDKEKMQLKVGAFVAMGLVVFMTVIFLLGSESHFFEKRILYFTRFSDISGLRVGSPVHLAGINIGSVEKIVLDDADEKKKVKVSLKIKGSFAERLREDSVASIVAQGVLGDKIISISVGNPDKPVLASGDELSSKSRADFNDVMEKGQMILENVNNAVTQANAILTEVREGKGVVHEVLYDPEGSQLVQDLRGVAQTAKTASGHISQITGKVNNGQGTIGALVNDPTLYQDMKTILGKANRNKLVRSVVRYTLKTKENSLTNTAEVK